VATTAYIANWPFAATKSAPEPLTALVRKSLLELDDRGILSAARVDGFKAATDPDFDGLRESIHRHEPK
jgi:ABC-type phosphate/phosphonate transport system substrate-binding protein